LRAGPPAGIGMAAGDGGWLGQRGEDRVAGRHADP